VLADIVAVTNATYEDNYNLYSVDCNATFQWNVIVSGKQFGITQAEALIKWNNVDKCFLAFDNDIDNEDLNVLGKLLTRNRY
jgi:hypothetical protein